MAEATGMNSEVIARNAAAGRMKVGQPSQLGQCRTRGALLHRARGALRGGGNAVAEELLGSRVLDGRRDLGVVPGTVDDLLGSVGHLLHRRITRPTLGSDQSGMDGGLILGHRRLAVMRLPEPGAPLLGPDDGRNLRSRRRGL
ncbi:hypothetical protein AB0E04_17915 [Streptomyces sp. NPDC048251]|uniref:hypothetical protein n=1 Tax=Streptomyces sp. NPDC048251 TaxID=3154501 RepID=UPI003412B52D